MDSFVSLEPGMMIWVWVTFAVFFFLLSKFAWKPILNAIESREKHVRETIENANRANEESQHLLEEHKALMDKAEAETQKMIAESKEIAEKMREDILRKAHEEADLALQKAKKRN
jgi:F-type H+-transporting ATPase subunit b